MLSFEKTSWVNKGVLVSSLVLIYGLCIIFICSGGKENNSAYDLYFKSSEPITSVNQLGLFTTMRLDFQRLYFDWTPVLDSPEPFPHPHEMDTGNDDEEEGIREYNTLDIDFESLIAGTDDKLLKNMHSYFANVKPTAKNEYTGKYAGYNVIFIVAESFAPYAVRRDITPTLY